MAVLAALAAVVLGAGGCSVLGLGGSSGSKGGAADAKKAQLPENTAYQAGQAVPSPSPGVNAGASPIRTPLGQLPSLPTRTATAYFNPGPIPAACQGRLREGVRNGLSVAAAGGGIAKVTWWEVGDPALQGYQLAAVSQAFVYGLQPPWKWQNVVKAGRCMEITATVTGLAPGKPYIFVLHAVIKNYENVPPIIPEIGRSGAVNIR
jgi:hypothetical protein